MNHSAYKTTGIAILFTLVISGIAAFVLPSPGVVTKVQGQSNERHVTLRAEIGVDKLPVKVRAFKNLQSEHWIKDLEIYIENKSLRSIYFLGLHFGFPEIQIQGGTYGFSVPLGDTRLKYENERASDSDKPLIPPGKEITVKLPDKEAKWLAFYIEKNGPPEAAIRKILLSITQINYGDGTGIHLVDQKWRNDSSNLTRSSK